MIHSPSVLFAFFAVVFSFFSRDQLVHANSTLWLSKLRWLWLNVLWWVACELLPLIGSHTMPGQHSQPTLILLVTNVRMFWCNLPPALLTGWPGPSMCHCSNAGWNGHWIRVSTESYLWRRKFSCHSCLDSNSQPFNHKCGALPTNYPSFPRAFEHQSADTANKM